MGHHRPASEMAFHWRDDDGRRIVVSTEKKKKKKKRSQSWTPFEKLSGSVHVEKHTLM